MSEHDAQNKFHDDEDDTTGHRAYMAHEDPTLGEDDTTGHAFRAHEDPAQGEDEDDTVGHRAVMAHEDPLQDEDDTTGHRLSYGPMKPEIEIERS